MTADQKQIKEWRKYHQQSRMALRVEIPLFAVECLVLYIVSLFVGWPSWLVVVGAIAIGMGILSIVLDAWNIIYLRSKLRSAGEAVKPAGKR